MKNNELLSQRNFSSKESLEDFKNKFEKITGMSFEDFRKNSVNTSKSEDEVDLRLNGFILYSDSHDNIWTLKKE